MKGGYAIAVVLVTAVVTISAENHPIRPIPKKCPAVDSPEFTVHLAHKSDCTKFYKCHSGEPVEMLCPLRNKKGDRLHFNALYQVCDFPESAGCDPTFTTATIDETTPTPLPGRWNETWNCKDAKEGTKLPHETRCYLYYLCVRKEKKLISCDENTHFDPYLQSCVKPSQSECPVEGPCRDYKKKEGEYHPDPKSCKHVYYCKGVTTVRYVCDEDAEWSVDDEKCLPTDKANCVRRFDAYW